MEHQEVNETWFRDINTGLRLSSELRKKNKLSKWTLLFLLLLENNPASSSYLLVICKAGGGGVPFTSKEEKSQGPIAMRTAYSFLYPNYMPI